MKKGKVMKIKKDYLIVLNEDMEYEKINKKGKVRKGQDIYYFKSDLYNEKPVLKKILLIASLFFVIALLNPSMLSVEESYGYINIDINPSVQLEINDDGEVLNVYPNNSEGESVIEKKWIGMHYGDVIDEIIEKSRVLNFLTEEDDLVFITYYSKDNKSIIGDSIKNKFTNKYSDVEIAITKAEKEDLIESHKNKVSLGETVFNKKIKENKEMVERIEEKTDEEIEQEEQKTNVQTEYVEEEENNEKEQNKEQDQDKDQEQNKDREQNHEQDQEKSVLGDNQEVDSKVEEKVQEIEQKQEEKVERIQENEQMDEDQIEEKIEKENEKEERKIDKKVLKELSKKDKEIKFIEKKKDNNGKGNNKSSGNNKGNKKGK